MFTKKNGENEEVAGRLNGAEREEEVGSQCRTDNFWKPDDRVKSAITKARYSGRSDRTESSKKARIQKNGERKN